ncbi:predicted protein [Escherichia albertii]|nr:predicted protein [Escherichia albertii]
MNILLLIYLLGVFFTSIVIFILSEETLLFRFFLCNYSWFDMAVKSFSCCYKSDDTQI